MKTTITLFLFSFLLFHQAYSQCGGADFEEKNGIVVIEMESAKNLPSNWKREKGVSGYTGASFIAWRGSDSFNTPGNGVITYKVKINSPGVYRFQWRNRVGIGNLKSEHNDSWLKIPDAFDFFAQDGSSIKYPKGGKFKRSNKTVDGASGNGWMKVFNSGGAGKWNWSTNTSDFDSHKVYAEFKSAGVYTIQVSGRSKGHFIDRMVLYKENQVSSPLSTSRGESKCGGGSGGGDDTSGGGDDNSGGGDGNNDGGNNDGGNNEGGNNDGDNNNGGENQAPTVSITSPSEGQNFAPGANVSINLAANDSDGNLTRHIIFVNGKRVDRDGSKYTTHTINDIAPGNYTVTAVVADNDGETAEDTVNFTVGNGDDSSGGGDNSGGDDNSGGGDSTGGDGNDGGNDGGDNNGDGLSVAITNPNDGQNYAEGTDIEININVNAPNGSPSRHLVFVNGKRVDRDNSKYTPHVISDIEKGAYTIRVEVIDGSGNKAIDEVNITVGDGVSDPGGDEDEGDNNDGGNGAAVTVSLINSSNNQVITSSISNGSTLGKSNNINFKANPPKGTQSVYFDLNGPAGTERLENKAPYALFGDNNGNYNNGNLPAGNYSLTVTAYSGKGRGGSVLGTVTINFSVGVPNSIERVSNEAPVIKAYPNPVQSNTVFVSLPKEVSGEVYYAIFNASGMELGNGSKRVSGSTMEVPMNNFSTANGGVYYVRVFAEGDTYTVPVIKK